MVLLIIFTSWFKQVQGYKENSDQEADAVVCVLRLLIVFFQVKQTSVQSSI